MVYLLSSHNPLISDLGYFFTRDFFKSFLVCKDLFICKDLFLILTAIDLKSPQNSKIFRPQSLATLHTLRFRLPLFLLPMRLIIHKSDESSSVSSCNTSDHLVTPWTFPKCTLIISRIQRSYTLNSFWLATQRLPCESYFVRRSQTVI